MTGAAGRMGEPTGCAGAIGDTPRPAATPRPASTPSLVGLAAPLRAFIARRVAPEHVDDVWQDVLLKVHRHSGQLRDLSQLSAWAYRIARTTVVDHHRALGRRVDDPRHARSTSLDGEREDEDGRAGRNAVVAATASLGPPVDEPAPEHFRALIGDWLRHHIGALPPVYADALGRVMLDGQSQAEAARQLGIPPSSLRTRVQRGRAQLHAALQRECELYFDARNRLVGCRPRQACRCAADPALSR